MLPALDAHTGTRTVMSDDGPIRVPANARRVVSAIGSFEIDMVAVGGNQPLRSWDTLFLSVRDVLDRRRRGLELISEYESRLEDLAALMRRLGIRVVGPAKSENAAGLERLPEIDSDRLIVGVGGDSMPRAVFEEASGSELYKKIPAVAAGRVHVVDGALWPGLGHLWARAIADDLERLFVA